MAKQAISLGTAPSGTGGDTNRSAFTKANFNFSELYDLLAGAANASALPANLAAAISAAGGYIKSNILGSVGQSGGVPTGAIMEYGENANGKYLKLAAGVMVCWQYGSVSYPINNVGGSLYHSQAIGFTFPVAFAASAGVPVVIPMAITPSNFYAWGALNASANNINTVMHLISPASNASSYAAYIAIGRWLQ